MYKYLKITSDDYVIVWYYIDIYGYITMKELAKCHCDLYLNLLAQGVSKRETVKISDTLNEKTWKHVYYITWRVPKKHSYTWKNTLK